MLTVRTWFTCCAQFRRRRRSSLSRWLRWCPASRGRLSTIIAALSLHVRTHFRELLVQVRRMQYQIRELKMYKPLETMTVLTFFAGLHACLHQAPITIPVIFDCTRPPPAQNLFLGSALLAPLIYALVEVDGSTNFEVDDRECIGV